MNTDRYQIIEFAVLIVWAISIGVMSVLKHDISGGASAAFAAYCASAAIKVTLS